MQLRRLAAVGDFAQLATQRFDFGGAGQSQHTPQAGRVMVLELFRPLDPQLGHHHQRPQQTPQAIPAVFQPAVDRSRLVQQVRFFEQRQAQ